MGSDDGCACRDCRLEVSAVASENRHDRYVLWTSALFDGIVACDVTEKGNGTRKPNDGVSEPGVHVSASVALTSKENGFVAEMKTEKMMTTMKQICAVAFAASDASQPVVFVPFQVPSYISLRQHVGQMYLCLLVGLPEQSSLQRLIAGEQGVLVQQATFRNQYTPRLTWLDVVSKQRGPLHLASSKSATVSVNGNACLEQQFLPAVGRLFFVALSDRADAQPLALPATREDAIPLHVILK